MMWRVLSGLGYVVDVSEVGVTDGVRSKRLASWHHICYGAGPPDRCWMGWEEVKEPSCELRGTLTPVGPQLMGFYWLFNKPGVSCFLGNFT